jgi:hypothetical protein
VRRGQPEARGCRRADQPPNHVRPARDSVHRSSGLTGPDQMPP